MNSSLQSYTFSYRRNPFPKNATHIVLWRVNTKTGNASIGYKIQHNGLVTKLSNDVGRLTSFEEIGQLLGGN